MTAGEIYPKVTTNQSRSSVSTSQRDAGGSHDFTESTSRSEDIHLVAVMHRIKGFE